MRETLLDRIRSDYEKRYGHRLTYTNFDGVHGLSGPCPACGAKPRPNYPDMPEKNGNYSQVYIATSGNRVRLRCNRGGSEEWHLGSPCSALAIAVALNLELHEFEPWNAPRPEQADSQPSESRQRTRQTQRARQTSSKQRRPRDTYATLRTCVQQVLDAPKGTVGTTVYEQFTLARAGDVEPAEAHRALVAAAIKAGMTEGAAKKAIEGREAWA